jgi:hypothetical protein
MDFGAHRPLMDFGGNREEAKRVRDETQARIESVGIDAWSREMRGRIPESFFR